MKVILSEEAKADVRKMDGSIRPWFLKHFAKIASHGPGRHLGHGVDWYVEEAGQCRVAYQVKGDVATVGYCFTTHKEYDKWLQWLRQHPNRSQ